MLNSYKRWTTKGIQRMVVMAAKGSHQSEIAQELRRSPKAVERKIHRLRHQFRDFISHAPFRKVLPTIIRVEVK